jgi:hypothetical protein
MWKEMIVTEIEVLPSNCVQKFGESTALTTLTCASLHCKLQTRPLIREGSLYNEERK